MKNIDTLITLILSGCVIFALAGLTVGLASDFTNLAFQHFGGDFSADDFKMAFLSNPVLLGILLSAPIPLALCSSKIENEVARLSCRNLAGALFILDMVLLS